MKGKRVLGAIILLGYLLSQLLSYLGYVERNTVAAADNNKNTSTQLVAVLVDDQIYSGIESDLKRYATQYIQKKYPLSKALILKINTKEYDAPEITKLLENLYFDGIKDQSSRLIGLVLVGDIPLPVVNYNDYIFPSIYPYVDFLEQKYLWNEEAGYFVKNLEEGQAELWHGLINFGAEIQSYHDFFAKLKSYDADPTAFVDKKIWYDDFIALKKNFLDEVYNLYQNKLLFAEDLMYHRYTDFFVRILQGNQTKDHAELLNDLAKDLAEFGIQTPELSDSITQIKANNSDYTPTKLLEQKLSSFLKNYHETLSTPLLNAISENVKASDRWQGSDSHYQKLHIKDQLLLGDTKTNGILKSINDKLEAFVDQKVEKENYAMKTTVPVYYQQTKDKKRRILFKKYYIPEFNDIYQFFYFGRNAQTISNAQDFSLFRGTYRNLSGFVNYSQIIGDPHNPAKTKEDKTDLTYKGVGSSYDLFSTQVESNRGYNILNMESEYALYQKEKQHARIDWHCSKRLFGLKRKWLPCVKTRWEPIGKCNPSSDNPKDWTDCENFQQFGNRVRGGATPLNLDMEKLQNQIYTFSGNYDPKSAWKEIYDIAGSVPVKQVEIDASSFKSSYTYSSPTKTARREGELKDATDHNLSLEKVWYFNVPLDDKIFKAESNSIFSLKREKKHRQDILLLYKYKIIPSKIKHDATTAIQINGYSGLKYSEDTEYRGYYTSIKEGLTLPQDIYSTPLLQKLNVLYSQLSSLKNQLQSAVNESNTETIRNLIPSSLLQSLAQISSGQAEVRGKYNDLITKNYAGDTKSTIEGIVLRQINQKEKIGLFQDWYTEIISKISSAQSFIAREQQVADQIFMTFLNSSKALDAIKDSIDAGISSHQGTGIQDVEIRAAWESLYQPLNQLSGTLGKINQLEPCNANHSILGSMLGKEEQQIVFGDENTTNCLSSLDEENSENDGNPSNNKTPLQTVLDDLSEIKTTFTTHFFSDPENPQVEISGMNILTPERPIDSPRYLSFQGVGENEIKLIYPNLFKIEIYDRSFGLKTPDNIRKALVQYLNNKVIEYNKILSDEKQKAKKLNQHYLNLFTVDKLATPSLESSVRSYQPFTYKEMLEAIGGEKMLNTLAELLYYQSISNQSKVYTDNIQQDIQNTKKSFDINEKIEYITDNYLTQKKDTYYQDKRGSYSKLIIPGYTSEGYEVGYINSNGDDSIIPDQDQLFGEIEKKAEVPQRNAVDESVGDAKEAYDIQRECGFDINEGLLLYNFKTGKFDWREGLKCWLQEIRKKPFEISLSFEGSLGSAPIQETIKSDIIAPLSDSRDTYKKQFKPSVAFQDLDPYLNQSDDAFVQEIFNQTQITTQNKKINILNKTGSFNFLSLKNYGNLTVKIASTGDNCLIINGQNTCISKAAITKNPFKNGFNIGFELGNTTVGTIIATLELCGGNGKCGTKSISLSAIPGPVKSFEIGLPQDRKILAGAYTLISLKALDLYKNEIQRTLEPYTIEVDKGYLVIGGQEKKSQEINDFQNLTLLYKGDPDSNGIVKFSVKNKDGGLLSSNTATLIPGKLNLEQNGSPLSHLNYQITTDHYFSNDGKGNMQLNTRKAIPLDLVLRDDANAIVPITTNVILGSKNGLAKVMTLQESVDGKGKKKLTLTPLSSLFIQEGKARVYIIPGYVSGEDEISMIIPGLKEKVLSLTIIPGSLAKITFNLEKEKLDPNTTSTAIINLIDAWGNKIKGNQKVTIEKYGPVSVSPYGTMNITNGEGRLELSSNHHGGLTKIYAEAQNNDQKIQGSTEVITKKFFLESSIESGLNIMYLNLFGSDRGNQRGYQSDNKKFSEHIITKSEKTLAITTQLVDLNKIKKTSLIFGKKTLENVDNHTIITRKDNGQLLLQVAGVGDFRVHDLWGKRKIHTTQSPNPNELAQETGKILHIYAIDHNFSYNNGSFKNQEGIEIANLDDGITFQRTSEQLAGKTIWNVIGRGQVLAKAVFTNIDFSKSTANLQNKEYEFGSIFSNGSTTTSVKALFSSLNVLKSDYQGYDSIQNSDEMEKHIGFRGDFKNITSFAGGLGVGEATLPFGSEFLINIGDPVLKRIDNNDNLGKADYNEGLGKVVYSDTEKTIFKTIDIDYNNDGLRDILVVYKDGEIRLQKQYQDKKFKDMGPLMLSAESIKEVFIGDIDGNDFEDIIVRNTKDQIRIYTNEDGVFDVDGKVACLNTHAKLGEITPIPENTSKVYQLFVKDMDMDGKIDIITLDTKGYLKIFYGKGSIKNHSYLSKNIYSCDEDRYRRQETSTKIVKKFGLQIDSKAIKDESLIRRDNLSYPTDEKLHASLSDLSFDQLGINIPQSYLKSLENGEAKQGDEKTIKQLNNQIDFTKMAQKAISVFDKYVKNPFEQLLTFEDGLVASEQALLRNDAIEAEDPVQVVKYYRDLNGGDLENGDSIQVQVQIENKGASFGKGGAFFDKIQGPWVIITEKSLGLPQNFKFIEGIATIHAGLEGYSYYLTDFQLSAKNRLIYSYQLTYQMNDPLFKINIDDIEIEDYSVKPNLVRKAPRDGLHKDGIPDFIVQLATDGCNKQQSLIFNTAKSKKRTYQETTVNLQELASAYMRQVEQQKENAQETLNSDLNNQSTNQLNQMPGIDSIQESFSIKDLLGEARSNMKAGENFDLGNIDMELFGEELTKIEHTLQDAADKMCNGFSFGLSNVESCEGLPVPFNQAFLAPGNYHFMGCIPIEPLTKTLGKGLPVFHFPGTLYTPVGSIPIPWGLKGPGDGFLWAGGGVYPSQIRIYAAPTLTAQLGLAICMGPYSAGINMPSPFSDIGGNCIVTSMPLPCGKSKSGLTNKKDNVGETYHSWANDYRETTSCELKQTDSPFKIIASALTDISIPTSFPERTYLGGAISIDYDPITSELDATQSGLEINGVKVQEVKDIKNAILGGKQQGLQKKLVWWFDRQVQYWINNLLRFRAEVIFPDMDHLSDQISTFNLEEIGKLTSEGAEKTEVTLSGLTSKFKKSQNLKTLAKNTLTTLHSKENLTALDLANGDNPFEKLQTFFNDKELVNISSQTLNVKIPWIYSEDIEAYSNYLKTREETNKEVLDARIKVASSAYLSCVTELEKFKTTTGASLLGKQNECKTIQDAKTQLMQMQSKFDKTSKQIYQNIQTLELYKRFPLEIYEWLHVSDKYLGEISALLSNFFGYINYWMEVNANRFTQYVDAIITILGVVKTYQVMVDLFVDWGKKCGKCTTDTYDQYSCKLSFLCPDLPILPIPSVKIPSLYIDLSHLNLGMDIVLPRFNFVPESIELPRLPNLPEPPQLGANFKIDFNIPDIPQLPEPPELPELPSFIPQVKMQLPTLPPAPDIPELPNQITAMVSIAKKLSKIYCIIKSGIGLVGESSVKARIEQMTQRTYNVPRVDNLDLTAYFKQTPLQGVDLQVDSYVNLQYNFDAFYSLLKSMVDTINQGTYHLTSQAQTFSDNTSNWSDETTTTLNNFTDNPINLNVQVGYKDTLKGNLSSLQQSLSTESEKQRLTPILALASTDTTISANKTGVSLINNQVSGLIKDEQKTIADLAQLAKSDYTSFLKTLEKKETQKPVQLSFSTNLLNDNDEAQKTIANVNPIEELITTESKRLQGYMLALNTHTALELNMTDKTYKNSVNYLDMIQSKLNQRNSIKTKTYAGEQTLMTKNGGIENKSLLTQVGSSKPSSHETSTTDMSTYIDGVLVKNHENNLVNVVHSKVNYEKFPSYYQQDLNNDKKPEVITWDDHNIYVKYANDTETQVGQRFKDFYVIAPQLKNKEKKYESFGGSWLFGGAEQVKVYDQNREVKNFRLGGQTFDSLNFSWTNNHNEAVSGYLMQISEEVGGLLEKYNQKGVRYLLFLPKGTDIASLKLQIAGSTFKVENQIGKLIYEVLYYNPSEDTLQFNLHEVPRKRQYLQLTTLKNEDNVYSKNAPRSNQSVGGRQIVGDSEPPIPKIELIRNRKPAVEDEGLDLQGYIGSYYDLQITWTDNVLVTTAHIEENKKQIAMEDINASQGTIVLKDLFFTKEQTKHYTIFAKDSEGNERTEEISLNIKIPGITIDDVRHFSGWKDGIENPILITSELEKDIDKGDVSFERERNGAISTLTATENGKKIQVYPVSTNQTTITGAYYDFGELIGLYTQDKKLIATVNGQNGEIKIQPAYQKTTELKVSFSKGYPVVNVIQNNKLLFEVILKSENLIQKEILQGTLYPLEGQSYGSFNGGEVIMKGKEPLLYISQNGSLRSNKPLQGTYQFNSKDKTVTYSLAENAFNTPFVKLTIKVKSL